MKIFSKNNILTTLFVIVTFLWLAIPFGMALLWSLVDPSVSWSYPDILPKKLSFERWEIMWEHSSIKTAMLNSYSLAPMVAIGAIIFGMPTAYALGRLDFKGKKVCEILVLLPLVMPGFVVAIFFASILYRMGFHDRYTSILIGHMVIFMPFTIRILSTSFSQVKDDIIMAAKDLGAGPIKIFTTCYLPVLKPGILASLIIVFILSIEEFALAFVIGSPDLTTIPTVLYSYLGYDFVRANAAVVSLILVVPNVILMLLLERALKSANPANVSGKG